MLTSHTFMLKTAFKRYVTIFYPSSGCMLLLVTLLHFLRRFILLLFKDQGRCIGESTSHQCGPCLRPNVDASGLNLLLVLSSSPIGFSPSTPVFHFPQQSLPSKLQHTDMFE